MQGITLIKIGAVRFVSPDCLVILQYSKCPECQEPRLASSQLAASGGCGGQCTSAAGGLPASLVNETDRGKYNKGRCEFCQPPQPPQVAVLGYK